MLLIKLLNGFDKNNVCEILKTAFSYNYSINAKVFFFSLADDIQLRIPFCQYLFVCGLFYSTICC